MKFFNQISQAARRVSPQTAAMMVACGGSIVPPVRQLEQKASKPE